VPRFHDTWTENHILWKNEQINAFQTAVNEIHDIRMLIMAPSLWKVSSYKIKRYNWGCFYRQKLLRSCKCHEMFTSFSYYTKVTSVHITSKRKKSSHVCLVAIGINWTRLSKNCFTRQSHSLSQCQVIICSFAETHAPNTHNSCQYQRKNISPISTSKTRCFFKCSWTQAYI